MILSSRFSSRSLRLSIGAIYFFLGLFATSTHAAESATDQHLKVSWLAPKVFGSGSEPVGIRFQIAPHWHVYWKNPGDSGAAPKFKFQSEGAKVSDVLWPVPKRFPIAHLTNIGYEDEVVYPVIVTPEAGATGVKIELKLEWLVCQEECFPGFATLTLERPVHQAPAEWVATDLKKVTEFIRRVPTVGALNSVSNPELIAEVVAMKTALEASNEKASETRELRLVVRPLVVSSVAFAKEFEVFPTDPDFLSPGAPRIEKAESGQVFYFQIREGARVPETAGFVVRGGKVAWEFRNIKILGGALSPAAAQDIPSLWLILFSALLGGLLLNLMPCVLPVLSIKFFSLAKAEAKDRVREGVLYTLGVLVTFSALGGLFLLLRAGGEAVGWGYQLQSPRVVLGLVLLFWLMGLNFFGFFEIGNRLVGFAGRFQNAGAFATGVLSVFVAAPCTGPFMGTALGAAATLPAVTSLMIFIFLGLGLASPFLLVAFVPALFKHVPKPGAWMERFKQFLAFPLFATVIWLLWVLGMQIGADGWLYGASLLCGVTFVIWLARSRHAFFKLLSLLILVAVAVATVRGVSRSAKEASAPKASTKGWVDFDEAVIQAAREKGQPVFVDFTAAWCITCQVNKKVVLETSAAVEIFKQNNVLLVSADWTMQDSKITKALAGFGRSSVPLYVYYGPQQAAPLILPQILSLKKIEELF